MGYQHQQLAAGRWQKFSLIEQLANVGSEVGRAINWRNKGNKEYTRLALERALELMDLTITDQKNNTRLKELARVREALVDYFVFDNEYGSTDKKWEDYFYAFNYAARKDK